MRARGLRRDALAAGATALLAFAVSALNLLRPSAQRLDLPNHDLFAEFLPRMHYAGNAFARGEFPLWDPHQAAGLPFHATLQGGLLYPPNWIYAWLPAPTALGGLALLHLAAAAAAAFALARDFGSSRAGSALCGLAFGAGGAALCACYHPNAVAALPWLPLVLLGVRRLARAPSPRAAAALALAVSLQFLAGRDYAFVLSLHCAGLLAAWEAAALARRAGARALAGFAGALALAAALAALLAAAQALPTLELAAESARTLAGPEPSQLESFGALPLPLLLANLVYPASGALRREYLGWIPLACFALSLGRLGRDRAASFAALVAALAIGIALGSGTPLWAAYRGLPLAALFRLPDRALWLLALAIALGAARGFDLLFEPRSERSARALRRGCAVAALASAALLAALASGALARPLAALWDADWGWTWFHGFEPRHFRALRWTALAPPAAAALLFAVRRGTRARPRLRLALVGVAAADLLWALGSPFAHPLRAPGLAFSGAPCFERARPLLGDFGRVLVFRLPDSHALEDKAGELFGLFSATHYDPLVTRRLALYFEQLERGAPPLVPRSPQTPFTGALTRLPPPGSRALLDLLGVRAVIAGAQRAAGAAGPEAGAQSLPLRGECRVPTSHGPARVEIRENPGALPRAFVVERALRVDGPEQARDAIAAPGFDARRLAVVEAAALPPALATAPGVPRPSRAEPGAQIRDYSPARIEIETAAEVPALLVLTDSVFPGWRARVNGEVAAIWPVDLLFRGVAVPAGLARVSFEYAPASFRLGCALSGAGILAAALCLGWRRPPAAAGAPE